MSRSIAAGVSEVFPRAEQRDDCFHVLYEMNKVRRRLERRAYAAIEREGEALGRLGKIRAHDKARRRKAKHALRRARRECAEAIERFDAFEAAMDTLRGALECVDIATGELHRPEHVQALIEGVAQRIESLAVGECAKLAKYLRNRAPGLVLAQKSVLPRLEALAEPWSAQAVSLACICWYLVRALHKRPARARHRALYRHLLAAYGALQDRLGAVSASLLEAVEAVLHQRHRASSAIEGFNAALRPYSQTSASGNLWSPDRPVHGAGDLVLDVRNWCPAARARQIVGARAVGGTATDGRCRAAWRSRGSLPSVPLKRVRSSFATEHSPALQ